MQIERVLVAARLSRDVEEVRRVLAGLGEAVKVEQARSREELRSLIEEKEPDLVVVFHPFPAFHGRDTSALVKKMAPGARVVLVAKDDSSAGDLACSGDGNPSVLPKDHLCDLATMAGLPAPQSAAWGAAWPEVSRRSDGLIAAGAPAPTSEPAASPGRKRILDNLLEMVVFLDPRFRVTWANKATCRVWGASLAEMIGRHCYEVWLGSSSPCSGCPVQRTLQDGKPYEWEVTFPNDRTAYIRSTPLRGDDGHLAGVVVTALEVTDRVRSREDMLANSEKLKRAMEGTIRALALTIEARDPHTAGHQRRVARLAAAIAKEVGLGEDRVYGLELAASIHDVGKIYVPAEILTRPRQLTPAEFDLVKTHPIVGYELLRHIDFPWPVARTVLEHHERLDGSGYPNGLSGSDILCEARMLAVADVVEAVASHRPYRPARGLDRALGEVKAGRGTLYDPQAVDACAQLFRDGFILGDDAGLPKAAED